MGLNASGVQSPRRSARISMTGQGRVPRNSHALQRAKLRIFRVAQHNRYNLFCIGLLLLSWINFNYFLLGSNNFIFWIFLFLFFFFLVKFVTYYTWSLVHLTLIIAQLRPLMEAGFLYVSMYCIFHSLTKYVFFHKWISSFTCIIFHHLIFLW